MVAKAFGQMACSELGCVRGTALPIIAAMPEAGARPQRRPMSSTHKAALAQGREEGRAVRRYLEAIEQSRPRRGRKRTSESVNKRLGVVKDRLPKADPLTRLHLLQEKADLEAELERATSSDDLAALERAFVKVASTYGQRKGIEYHAWRAAGVSAAVLQRADITRASTAEGTAKTTKTPRISGTTRPSKNKGK